MKSGELRRRIVIEAPTKVSDGMGGVTETWNPLSPLDMFAQIEPASAEEIKIMDGQNMKVTHRLTTRFRTDIKPTIGMRIRYPHQAGGFEDRLFKINGLINLEERNRTWHFMCEEGYVQYAEG